MKNTSPEAEIEYILMPVLVALSEIMCMTGNQEKGIFIRLLIFYLHHCRNVSMAKHDGDNTMKMERTWKFWLSILN